MLSLKKYRTGYTSGVFDLFHIGHLNILKRAKERCEFLIVGVTTDGLVYDRKAKYPVIPFEERMEIVESVRYVDRVIPQADMDKLNVCQIYMIDVVFVGDDWKGTESWIRFEKEFGGIGVDVVYFPYTSCTSSTILTEFITKGI